MSKKTWKDHLLSSGIPLEYSVAHNLEELEIWRPGEFSYERRDPNGTIQIFSVDVHASHIDTARNVWLETLVECKYRHDGTRWVFTPRNYEPVSGDDFGDLFVTLDQCCVDRELNHDLLGAFRDKYPLCGKGIELLPEDANPKSIEQAVRQLRDAVVAKALDAIVHQVDGLLGTPTPLFVIVPIIVTTAELWRLRRGTCVEDVRRAEEINEVADPCDLVVLHDAPDSSDKQDTVARFGKELDERQVAGFDRLLSRTSHVRFASFVDRFAESSPSLFVVIRYDRFRTAISNLHRFFQQNAFVRPR